MKNKTTRIICEGAVLTALALALSYVDIPIGVAFGGFGGSINLTMIPIIVFAIRAGLGWGLGAGLVFGTAKFFFAGGVAINWQSMLLDYSVAYMAVGFAALAGKGKWSLPIGAVIGSLCRFAVHFLSGITIYAIVAPEEIMGIVTASPFIFSLLYNGSYMLPSSVLAVLVCWALAKPLEKLPKLK